MKDNFQFQENTLLCNKRILSVYNRKKRNNIYLKIIYKNITKQDKY